MAPHVNVNCEKMLYNYTWNSLLHSPGMTINYNGMQLSMMAWTLYEFLMISFGSLIFYFITGTTECGRECSMTNFGVKEHFNNFILCVVVAAVVLLLLLFIDALDLQCVLYVLSIAYLCP